MHRSAFREVAAQRAGEWEQKGHKRRHFFAHRLVQLPKCGPDAYKLAERMCGIDELDRHRQLLVYADPELVEPFPPGLFLDDDLLWHQQHLGRVGQIASATLVDAGETLYSIAHHSDLVQRIGARVREHKTQVEKRFDGWPRLLINGALAIALERGFSTVRVPSSDLAMRHTDPARDVRRDMFERVYDRSASELPGAVRSGEWWELDVAAASAVVVEPVRREETLTDEKTVCVLHDLEGGLGHRAEDPDLARRADSELEARLEAMLAVEAGAGVTATYNIVGTLLDEVRGRIEAGGHTLAFHSFDHGDGLDQLHRCREVDYRLKGYRLPRSRPTPETTDRALAFHNFEWLASSAKSLGVALPELRNRLVRLPVTLDDFDLYTGRLDYPAWHARVLAHVERGSYTAVGLHDCYAHHWLPHYPELLEELQDQSRLRTLDEVSAAVLMASAV